MSNKMQLMEIKRIHISPSETLAALGVQASVSNYSINNSQGNLFSPVNRAKATNDFLQSTENFCKPSEKSATANTLLLNIRFPFLNYNRTFTNTKNIIAYNIVSSSSAYGGSVYINRESVYVNGPSVYNNSKSVYINGTSVYINRCNFYSKNRTVYSYNSINSINKKPIDTVKTFAHMIYLNNEIINNINNHY